ncbi:DUF1294 domain-containing protein [Clostridium moniliforme]|nr:DUF1294 domain-containing protein [Clostridium moniliforme]
MSYLFKIYFIIINLIGFFSMLIDKEKAKKHKWRIPENTLIFIALIGGSIGSFIAMNFFRHKTKHFKFKVGIPIILIIQLILIYCIKISY